MISTDLSVTYYFFAYFNGIFAIKFFSIVAWSDENLCKWSQSAIHLDDIYVDLLKLNVNFYGKNSFV